MAGSHAITTERLVNVLQSIALRQQTGRLSVEHVGQRGRENGEIFFARGNTVFAHTAYESGETALFNMLRWQVISTTFFESEQAPVGIGNIQRHSHAARATQSSYNSHSPSSRPMLPIEMEETRQTPAIGMPIIPKTMRSIPAHIPAIAPQGQQECASKPSLPQLPQTPGHSEQPGMHAIFRALPQASKSKIIHQMERKDRIVFLLLDGKRTLHTIKHLLHRSELDIAHTLVRLLKQGYIEYIQG